MANKKDKRAFKMRERVGNSIINIYEITQLESNWIFHAFYLHLVGLLYYTLLEVDPEDAIVSQIN